MLPPSRLLIGIGDINIIIFIPKASSETNAAWVDWGLLSDAVRDNSDRRKQMKRETM